MRYLGSIPVSLYGASSGVVDLGAGGWQPLEIVAQADLRTNSGYEVGLLVSKAASSVIGTNFAAAQTGANSGNQPANDGVELVSDDAGDIGRVVTVYGTTYNTNIITSEELTTNGTTQVASTKTDWGNILGIEVDSAHATATLTLREASANATIDTIAATATQTGVADVATASQNAYGLPIAAFGSGASTEYVGAVGTDICGNTMYSNQITLSGTTVVYDVVGLHKVTKLLFADPNVNVTFEVGRMRYGAAEAMLSDGGVEDDGEGRKLQVNHRYLHWCLVNGTTASTGGVDDRLLIKCYG